MALDGYPFARGPVPIGVRTIGAHDPARDQVFPVEIWHPAAGEAGPFPLIVFSHHSGGGRRAASFLQTHLASHGYVVAAMDHSELVAPPRAFKVEESKEQAAARIDAIVAARVPDLRFLIDHMLDRAPGLRLELDHDRIGACGHSFGGWTVLAAAESEPRIKAIVALAPGGASRRKPGILPLPLTFDWGRDVPTLYLAAREDASLPLEGMYELYERTRASKRLAVLHRADHLHFVDDVETLHEAVRTTPMTGELAWLNRDMKPFAKLCSGADAHLFTRSLTLWHMDQALKGEARAPHPGFEDVVARLVAAGVGCSVA